jgi:uncharacterized NAD-dependent epimerase/dehydratase family protein
VIKEDLDLIAHKQQRKDVWKRAWIDRVSKVIHNGLNVYGNVHGLIGLAMD